MKDLAKDPKWRTRIIEKPEVWGLESVSGDALVIRLVMKTRANAKDDVARELRMRVLKRRSTSSGSTLPQLNSIMLSGLEGAQRVRGANPPKTKPTRGRRTLPRLPSVPCGGRRRRRRTSRRARPRQPEGRHERQLLRRGRRARHVRAARRRVLPRRRRGPGAAADVPRGGSRPRRRSASRCSSSSTGADRRTYSQERGHPRLRMRHSPFHVNPDARDRWLAHMRAAVDELDLPPLHEATLWDYLQRAAHRDGQHLRADRASARPPMAGRGIPAADQPAVTGRTDRTPSRRRSRT